MTTEHRSIYEAINAVMTEVGYVQKKKGGDIPYKFAGEAALIEALRPSMVEHGIVVYPAGVSEFKLERETSGKGTQYTHVHGLFSFVFQHVDSDTCVITQVVGEGIDYGDKAASKASTIAFKYALRQTFTIETGDDPDKYGSDNDFGGLKSGNQDDDEDKPRRSTNVTPKNGNPAVTPPAPASATPAPQGTQEAAPATEWPADNAVISQLDGKALYTIQTHGPALFGIDGQGKHFTKRFQERFGVKNLNDINQTWGDFKAVMILTHEEWEAQQAGRAA